MSTLMNCIKEKRIPIATTFLVGLLFLMTSCSGQESPAVETSFPISSTPQKVLPVDTLGSASPTPSITSITELVEQAVCLDFVGAAIADSYKNRIVYSVSNLEE